MQVYTSSKALNNQSLWHRSDPYLKQGAAEIQKNTGIFICCLDSGSSRSWPKTKEIVADPRPKHMHWFSEFSCATVTKSMKVSLHGY